MTSPVARRATAVIAVMATSLGAAALSGAAFGAGTLTHTSLSIRAVRPSVAAGGTDHISGDLHAAGKPAAGKAVELLARPSDASSFTEINQATTGAHGAVRFAVSPTATTRYRLAFAGDSTDRQSRSGVVMVKVAPSGSGHAKLGTSLSIRSARRSTNAGGTDRITGRLRSRGHRLVGKQVVLQDKLSGAKTWSDLASHRSGRRGRVGFSVSPSATTRYRLLFRGTVNFARSHSGVRAVHVRTTGLTVNAAKASIDRGDTDTVSGVLTDSGAPVDGASVQLRSRPVSQHKGAFTAIATGTTGSDGSVSFAVTPTASTRYVLVFAKTATEPAARSHVVTVRIRAGSSLSIRGRSTARAFVVSGVLLGNGHALRGRRVQLLRRNVGSSDAFTIVRRMRTGKHGRVVFRRRPASATDFELRFPGGARFDAATSGVVTDPAT